MQAGPDLGLGCPSGWLSDLVRTGDENWTPRSDRRTQMDCKWLEALICGNLASRSQYTPSLGL